MSSMYPKNGRIYFRLKVGGEWTGVKTEFIVGQERQAQAILDQYDARIAAGEAISHDAGPVTNRRYYAVWIKEREEQISTWKNDEYVMRLHVLPVIGDMRVDGTRPKHLVELFRGLKRKMSPKSLYNAYSTLCAFFRDALLADLISEGANPCILTKRQLGEKQDKDPEWRPTAIFGRPELETLISDKIIPMDRRVFYGLLGIAGLRYGEAAGLHFRNCPMHPKTPPLDMLFVAFSYGRAYPKGGKCRPVPIHPTLAAMLAEWKLYGWAEMMGREPTPDDLVMPLPPAAKSKHGRWRRRNYLHDRLEEDLQALQLRHRRGHDLRRTMISLTRSDGADAAILKRATHKPPKDVIEGYTTFEWEVVCREISKLQIHRRGERKVISIPLVSTADGEMLATDLATTSIHTTEIALKKPWPPPDSNRDLSAPTGSYEPPPSQGTYVESQGCVDGPANQSPGQVGPDANSGSKVASRLRALRLVLGGEGE